MKILIVEDEHKIANSIKQGLVQENFAVEAVRLSSFLELLSLTSRQQD
ncbi:MAG: hypothetical protein Q8P29_01715 [Candidatus Levybacteria bacterium]|nr:hypothetical protein [Candidatus Levybacteria bacterium]